MNENKKSKKSISDSKILLTILVPVYNMEKYIEKCLKSLADNKLNGKIEVIVVSDGSTDNSIKIAREIKKNYSKIFRIIEKENGGHGSTINVGIKEARGKYFRVLDSDDWFDKKEFLRFVSKLETCDSDLVISNFNREYVYDGVSEIIKFDNLKDSREYKFDDFDLEKLNNNFFAMSTMTYKTSVLRKSNLNLPEKTFYVDMIYDLIPIPYVDTFTYFDCNIYRYFIGREGQSVNINSYIKHHIDHNNVTKNLIEYYARCCNTTNDIKKKYMRTIIKKVINTNYLIYCVFYKKKREAIKSSREFDSYLKHQSIELYNDTNISFIKIFRKFKFIIILLIPNFIKIFIYKYYLKIKNGGKE